MLFKRDRGRRMRIDTRLEPVARPKDQIVVGIVEFAGGRPFHHEAVAAGMANQIRVLDIDDADQCLALFKSNTVVGWLIFGGLVAGSLWMLAT